MSDYRIRRFLLWAPCFLLLVCLCCGSVFAFDGSNPFASGLTLVQEKDSHTPYVSGLPDGTFRPDSTVSRAEAASMLYQLLEVPTSSRIRFADVSEDAWYYDAIGCLAAEGVLEYSGNTIRPSEAVTRGEFAGMLARITGDSGEADCSYSDVPVGHPRYAAIAAVSANGWITGFEDGTFRPEDSLTRAQAVSILNRVLNRQPCESRLEGREFTLPLFSDVPKSHWAYADILEAALQHTCLYDQNGQEFWAYVDTAQLRRETGFYVSDGSLYYIAGDGFPVLNAWVGALYFGEDGACTSLQGETVAPIYSLLGKEAGFYLIDGDLFYVNESGLPVSDTTVQGLYFGSDGRYTCGDSEIDSYTKAILAGITDSGMTRMEMLRAAYNYVRDSYTYLRRNYYNKGDTGWELEEARTMYSTGRGNCYCYASAFYYLALRLGYPAQIVSGTTGHNASPHGWVDIPFNGTLYIFDTELEMAYRKKGVYYNFFQMSYSAIPWPYSKA